MSSMIFVINDDSIGARKPRVQVTITENNDGTLRFDIVQLPAAGAYIGDLRGFFFDVGDESLIGTLSASNVSGARLTDFEQRNDGVRSLGLGADIYGLLGTGNTVSDPNNNRGYDVGLEIGTWRVRHDDVRAFQFTLGSSDGPLTLDDFANVDFGVRVASIGRDRDGDGTIDTFRFGGAKLVENTFDLLDAADDAAGTIEEGATASGNVLGNDIGPGTKVLTGVSYKGVTIDFSGTGPIVVALTDHNGVATGATATIFADGRYAIDATQADTLFTGQQIAFDIVYQVKQTVLEANGSVAGTTTAEAHLTGTLLGAANEAPVIHAPATLTAAEDQPFTVSGFSIGDDSANLTVTLTANSLLTLNGIAGLAFSQGDGTADETMTFSGSLADINAALDGLVYGPAPDFSGVGFVFYLVDDGENVTAGSLGIDVTPDADVPVFTMAEPAATTPLPATQEIIAEAMNSPPFMESGAPTIAALAGGGFVLVWETSGTDIEFSTHNHAQLFDAEGQALGHAFDAGVSGGGGVPFVVALADGGFVVISTRPDFDGNVFAVGNIYGQRYDADGVVVGSAFRINAVPGASPSSVSALADGGFVVTWRASDQDRGGVFARRYDASAAPVGGQFQVNTTTIGSQWDALVVGLPDGGFVVTWSSPDQSGDGVFAQRFDETGAAVGGEFRVNTTTGGHQDDSAVAALAGGGFVVTWLSHAVTERYGNISVRLYDSSGAPLGGEFVVATNSTATTGPAVVALPDGGFIVAWNAASQDSPDDPGGVYAQRFDANGEAVGEEFRINHSTQGIQAIDAGGSDLVLAVLASGDLVATWTGERDDPFGGIPGNIFARLFSIDGVNAPEDTVVTLPPITAALNDTDGSEALKLVLGGFPEGATFSKGHADGATWVIDDPADIATLDDIPLTMTPPPDFSGSMTLSVQVVVTDTAALSTGTATDTTSATQDIAIDIAPAADAPVLTIGSPALVTPHPLTDEFIVNSHTANSQEAPSIAALNDGGYVVTWLSQLQDGSGFGIYAQRYGADHAPIGGEFRVNTTTARDQLYPSVVGLDGGGFVVTWMSFDEPSFAGIYGQRYDASGAPLGGEFLISTEFNEQYCSLTALDGGGFVVVWQSIDPQGEGSGIYGQRFDAGGSPVGDEFRVSPVATDGQVTPSVTALGDGGFVLTWSSPQGVFAQRYGADGAASGAEFFVSDGSQPVVAALADGGFVIAWTTAPDFEQENVNDDIDAQRFDASGNPVGGRIRLNSSAPFDQLFPSLAALPDGGFIAMWDSYGQDGDGYGVYGQRVDADGSLVGDEFRVSQSTAGQQTINVYSSDDKTIAVLASGEVVATWFGDPSEDLSDIHARVFSLDATAEGGPVTLPPITAALNDTDGSESLKLALSGFPEGATFSRGHIEGADWVIDDPADIAALDDDPLTMTPPENFSGSVALAVRAVVTDTATLSTGTVTDTTSVTQQIAISVSSANDSPATADVLAATNEGATVVGRIGTSDPGPEGSLAAFASSPGSSGYFLFDDDGADAAMVLWDATGGGIDAVAFARLQAGASLAAADFLIG